MANNIGEVSIGLVSNDKDISAVIRKWEASLKKLGKAWPVDVISKQVNADLKKADKAIDSFTKKQRKPTELSVEGKKLNEELTKLSTKLKTVQAELDKANKRIKTLEAANGPQKLNKALDNLSSKVASLQTNVGALGNRFTLLFTLPVVAAVTAGIRSFASFEDGLANVRKSAQLTEAQTKSFGQSILAIAPQTRTSIDELLRISVIGGQLGVAEKDLLSFVKVLDQATIALGDEFGGGAEEISRQLGTLVTQFKLQAREGGSLTDAYTKAGSALNELGAASNATAPYIADFTNRVGAIAPLIGLTFEQTAALGATFQELGQSVEVAGTATTSILTEMGKDTKAFAKIAGTSQKEFERLLRDDVYSALILVSKGVKRGGTDIVALSKTLDGLGIDGQRAIGVLGQLAGNTDLVAKNLAIANPAYRDGISLSKEAEIKNNTLAASFGKLSNTIQGAAISLGETASPELREFVDQIIQFVRTNDQAIKQFARDFVKGIVDGFKTIIRIGRDFLNTLKPVIELIGGGSFSTGLTRVATALLLLGPGLKLLAGGLGVFRTFISLVKALAGAPSTIKQVASSIAKLGKGISGKGGVLGSLVGGVAVAGIGTAVAGLLSGIGKALNGRAVAEQFVKDFKLGRFSFEMNKIFNDTTKNFVSGFLEAIPVVGGALSSSFEQANFTNAERSIKNVRTLTEQLTEKGINPSTSAIRLMVEELSILGSSSTLSVEKLSDVYETLTGSVKAANTAFDDFITKGKTAEEATRNAINANNNLIEQSNNNLRKELGKQVEIIREQRKKFADLDPLAQARLAELSPEIQAAERRMAEIYDQIRLNSQGIMKTNADFVKSSLGDIGQQFTAIRAASDTELTAIGERLKVAVGAGIKGDELVSLFSTQLNNVLLNEDLFALMQQVGVKADEALKIGIQSGLSNEAIKELLRPFGTEGDVAIQNIGKVRAELQNFKDDASAPISIKVNAETNTAQSQLKNLIGLIGNVPRVITTIQKFLPQGFDRGGMVGVQRFARGGMPKKIKPVYANNGNYAKGADVIPAMLRAGEMVLPPMVGTGFKNFLKSITKLPNVSSGFSQGGARDRIEKVDSGMTFNVDKFYGTNPNSARKNASNFGYGLKHSLLNIGY